MMRLKYSILLLILILVIARAGAFEDDFNDCILSGDWSITGSVSEDNLRRNYDGSCTLHSSTLGIDGSATASLDVVPQHYQWMFYMENSPENWGANGYMYFLKNGGTNIGFYLQSMKVKSSNLPSYGDVTLTNQHWYNMEIIFGASLTVNIYDITGGGGLVNSQTISMPTYTAYQFYVSGVSGCSFGIENVLIRSEYAGAGTIDAPSTVPINVLANISYNITANSSSMDYFVYVYDTYGQKTEYNVSDVTGIGYVEYSTVGKTEGVYTTYLIGRSKTSMTDYILASDTMYMDAVVDIYGITRNGMTGAALGSVNVSFYQQGGYFNTTSDANGNYNLSDLNVGYPILVNASKANYTHLDYSTTPTYSYNYSVDLYLYPVGDGSTRVHGMTLLAPWYQYLSAATVNLWNETISDSTVSDSNGYYYFNLTNFTTDYNINASKTGYSDVSTAEIEVITNQWTVYNLVFQKTNEITIRARDDSTGSYLLNFNADIDGDIETTTTGLITYDVEDGVYYVSCWADGYYMDIESLGVVTSDQSVTFDLIPINTTNIYEIPGLGGLDYLHYVRFILTDLNGTMYNNVNTTVYENSTAILVGITGDDGAVGFELNQNVSYTLTFINDSQGINISRTLYPVESLYFVYLEDSVGFSTGNVSTNLTDFNITYFNESFSLQNITGSYLTSNMGFNALSQGIIAGGVNWIIIGAGGPFAAIISTVIMAVLGILSWAVVLFTVMTIISIWVLKGNIG